MRAGIIKICLLLVLCAAGFIMVTLGSGEQKKQCIGAEISFAGKKIIVETAITGEQRRVGLMHRKSLPQDSGMLFVFEEPEIPSFWMKDTSIPLSIAFITEKLEITNILKMVPFDTETKYSPDKKVKYALEMNAGWFNKNGIKAGDKIISIKLAQEQKNEIE